MKHFISALDVPDIQALLDRAFAFKAQPLHRRHYGVGRTLGLVFLNPSTRTRISTQVAARNLGMEVMVFNAATEGWAMEFQPDAVMNGNTVEHIREAARVMGQYFDIIGVRSFPELKSAEGDREDAVLKQYQELTGIPVVSLESSRFHPLQSLTDIMTIRENWPHQRKPKVALTWAPHIKALPHCVPNSLAQWMNAWGGADFVIAHPEGHELSEDCTKGAHITHNQQEALDGADFVYVKNWSSTTPYGEVIPHEHDWMLTPEKLQPTNNTKVMHCLPVRRNVELSGAVLDGPNSIVTQQAGNRVWAAQAVLEQILLGLSPKIAL